MSRHLPAKMFLLCIAMFCGLLASSTEVPGAESLELSYATMWPQAHAYSLGDQIWIERIERQTNGAVKIKPFWQGTLVSANESMAEATAGIADIVCISPVYEKAGVDLTRMQTAFYQGTPIGVPQINVFWALWNNFPEFRNEYRNMKVLAISAMTQLRLMTKKPVRSLADLKGMRVKAPRELIAPLKHYGAEGVIVPTPDVYMMLQKGILDGAFTTADAYKSMRLIELIKFDTNLTSVMGPFPNKAMSLKSWNKLSPELKKIFEASGEQWTLDMLSEVQKAEAAGIDLAKKSGVTFITLPPAENAAFEELCNAEALKGAQEVDAKGLPGTKMFNEARRLVKEYNKK
jgi:TRAP-type transport system periplasmic protein